MSFYGILRKLCENKKCTKLHSSEFSMLKVAVEKQIGKNPIVIHSKPSVVEYYCPTCGRFIGKKTYGKHRLPKHIAVCECGQHLEWWGKENNE